MLTPTNITCQSLPLSLLHLEISITLICDVNLWEDWFTWRLHFIESVLPNLWHLPPDSTFKCPLQLPSSRASVLSQTPFQCNVILPASQSELGQIEFQIVFAKIRMFTFINICSGWENAAGNSRRQFELAATAIPDSLPERCISTRTIPDNYIVGQFDYTK